MKQEKYALLSVFDKTGIVDLARQIIDSGYKIISTGGTAKILTQNNISVTPIQEITGSPESFDGRMKTISFQIESGILFDRTNPKHVKESKELNIPPIDLVVCNLYPFEETIKNPKVKLKEAIENIDVGGPTMIRSAAKNFEHILVVVDPSDYETVSKYLHDRHSGKPKAHPESDPGQVEDPKRARMTNQDFRKQLAAKAFAHLSFYDAQITRFLSTDQFPKELVLPGRKNLDLRYGENPHQQGAVYFFPNTNTPLQHLRREWGRELSHVNITDINAGLESVQLFTKPAAVIIKHNSPCGLALGKTSAEALKRAIAADPESAFGGIIVLNVPLDLTTAKEIGEFKDERRANIDIVAAPEITKEALMYLQKVRKSMGIYTFGQIPKKSIYAEHIKFVDGGFVVQNVDNVEEGFRDWKVVTKIKPNKKQLKQMQIAWKFISRIRSNAIIVMDKRLPMTRGIGSGQTSRIRSTKLALEQAGMSARGAVLASDSFFPFDDSVKLAADAGITAIVQQGGSINDIASIKAANDNGITMVFTNRRAFWH